MLLSAGIERAYIWKAASMAGQASRDRGKPVSSGKWKTVQPDPPNRRSLSLLGGEIISHLF